MKGGPSQQESTCKLLTLEIIILSQSTNNLTTKGIRMSVRFFRIEISKLFTQNFAQNAFLFRIGLLYLHSTRVSFCCLI